MYYELNVTDADRRHLFATAPRSCTTVSELRKLLRIFREKFPEPEFFITVSRRQDVGYQLTGADIDLVLRLNSKEASDA